MTYSYEAEGVATRVGQNRVGDWVLIDTNNEAVCDENGDPYHYANEVEAKAALANFIDERKQ